MYKYIQYVTGKKTNWQCPLTAAATLVVVSVVGIGEVRAEQPTVYLTYDSGALWPYGRTTKLLLH